MQVPSVVFVRRGGEIVVGEAAEQQGAAEPSRVVREFKRRIGDSVPLVVGGAPFSAQALTARLLAWVVGLATERQGGPPEHVCVTHPANWGPFKRDLLGQAVEMAGLRNVEMCTEPEAAAITYASRNRVAEGDRVAVYDLGGGTFDAAVLVPDGAGFRLAGPPEGVEQLGGIDFDEAVFRHVLTSLGPEVADLDDTDPATATALARLRRDCVEAKEVLSFSIDTVVPVALPGITKSVRLTRGDLDDMLRPAIGETVAATRRVLDSAGVDPADLAAIVLVGGSSRIPLVSEMLSAEFGRPLALDNHPKHDVALGAAIRGTPAARPAAARPASTAGGSRGRGGAAGGGRRGCRPRDLPAARRSLDGPGTGRTVTAATAAYAGADTGAAPADATGPPPGPSPDWRPPSAVGPMTSPAGATGLTARLPAAVTGKRGRMLIGTGAVVVALAVGAGILLGTRKAEPDPSLTGVQSPIPTFAPAPLPVPVPAWCRSRSPSETLTARHDAHAGREAGPQAGAGHDDHAAPAPGPSSHGRHRNRRAPAPQPPDDHDTRARTPDVDTTGPRSPPSSVADPAVGLADDGGVTRPCPIGRSTRCPSGRPRAPGVFASAVPGCRHGVGRRTHAQPRARRRRRCLAAPQGGPADGGGAGAGRAGSRAGPLGRGRRERDRAPAARRRERRCHRRARRGGSLTRARRRLLRRTCPRPGRARRHGRPPRARLRRRPGARRQPCPRLGRRGQRERLHGRLQHRLPARPLRPGLQPTGKLTLAHELTHVVQQRSGPVDGTPASGGIKVSDPSDRFEREAAANAERVMSGPAPAVTPTASGPAVQRCGDDGEHDVQRSVDSAEPAVQREGEEEEEPLQGSFTDAAVQREGEDEEEMPRADPAQGTEPSGTAALGIVAARPAHHRTGVVDVVDLEQVTVLATTRCR